MSAISECRCKCIFHTEICDTRELSLFLWLKIPLLFPYYFNSCTVKSVACVHVDALVHISKRQPQLQRNNYPLATLGRHVTTRCMMHPWQGELGKMPIGLLEESLSLFRQNNARSWMSGTRKGSM